MCARGRSPIRCAVLTRRRPTRHEPISNRLTVGPPCGRIRELVTKVSAINAKYGPFDALLCLGDVFRPHKEGAELSVEETELIEGSLKCACANSEERPRLYF